MVGVKGKYKGCNTCRKRRVACDNTRPRCKKCTDHGRDCEGYQTETVFIVGTLEDKGRCASHPPRNLQASLSSSSLGKKKAEEMMILSPSPEPTRSRRRAVSESQQEDTTIKLKEVIPTRSISEDPTGPTTSGWEDFVDVASVGGLHRLRFAAIHTKLKSVKSQHQRLADREINLCLSTSRRVVVTPTFDEEAFKLEAKCFVHLPKRIHQSSQSHSWNTEVEDGLCLFLYEQNCSASYSNKAPWKDPIALNDPIRQLGPSAFQTFPEHHFFTRIYRPNAIFAALLNQNPTHLVDPEWITTPWENSAKTPVDTLLDIIAKIPSLISRADYIVSLPSSLQRHLQTVDLMRNCTAIETEFESWYVERKEEATQNVECPLLYWPWRGESGTIGSAPWGQGQMPFEVTYDFPCAAVGLAHIYYWTGLIVLYRTMNRLLAVADQDKGPSGTLVATPILTSGVPVPPCTTNNPMMYLQPQLPSFAYGSPAGSTHSYASASGSAEDLSSLPTNASIQCYQASPNSSYHQLSSPNLSSANLAASDIVPNMEQPKYEPREIRKLAAHVCKSLDWAIRSFEGDALGPLSQPDLVAAPLYIVERYYEDIGAVGDGQLERLWCRVFRERWEFRAKEIESAIFGSRESTMLTVPGSVAETVDGSNRRWIELGKFGV